MDAPSTVLRVALAAGADQRVNQHFGSARSFTLVALTESSEQILEQKAFGAEKQDGKEDKLVGKIVALRRMGADVLVCAQVGPSAVKQLLQVGIQPIAVAGAPAVSEVLEQLQTELQQGTASWARRVRESATKSGARFDDWLDEEWDEGS